jgi:hypothetical protein
MFTLAASDTLAGIADAGSQLTYTIFGMELSGITESYKVLAQGQLDSSAGTIYAPSAVTAFIRTVTIVNTDAVAAHTFQLFRGGTGAANAITPVLNIPAGGSAN